MKKLLLFGVFALFFTLGAVAQEVSGTVLGDDGVPLPGASVLVKGTTVGTTTDFDGNYVIEANQGDTLVFSFIGFDSQEVQVSGSTVNVTLSAGVQLDQVVVVGSRNANRTATDTPVPVDVLDVTELVQSAPQVTVTEILNYAAPSFSSNPQTISDGTDHIAPASLRGLGPDQVLVLINGKRRHKTALVNVNGTFGRGSVGTDMTTIPSNAISRIEILRDGAAAQYGSDAIAGVINIVLKRTVNELTVDMTTGANFTSEASPQKDIDGEKVNLGLNYGLPIGDDGGFINFTGNFNYRNWTNRMQEFSGQIFNGYNTIERLASNAGDDLFALLSNETAVRGYAQNAGFSADQLAVINAASDVELHDASYFAGLDRLDLIDGTTTVAELQTALGNLGYADAAVLDGITDYDDAISALQDANGPLSFNNTTAELASRGQVRSDYNMRVGQSRLRSGSFFANMAIPLGEDLELYGNGGLNFKTGNAAGFYRLPFQARAYTPAYLNGFLPEINSSITDKSYAIGIRGIVGDDWNIDFSNTFGRNDFSYRVTNSNNASLQNSTPFEADSGGFNYSENTTNIDMSKFHEDIFAGFNLAFGAEYRVENYGITAGEEASYAQYNTDGNVHDPTDATSTLPTDFFRASRPGGIQVFPGFRPENEINAFRNSVAAYVDAEADFTEAFLVSGAVRYENFSDFGGTLNFKLASRLKASENLNFRAGFQTGFRAPSLHQIHYSATNTLFVDGVPNEVGTFSNISRVAQLLGIESLKEETSIGFTAGFTAKIPSANLKITLDGYLVNIDDRVVLTGQFEPELDANGDPVDAANAELQTLFEQANATRAAFFANAVDTQTKGIDIVMDHSATLSDNLRLNSTLAFTFSETTVENVNIPTAISNAGLSDTYFDRTSRIFIEAAVPRTKGNLSNTLLIGDKTRLFLRNSFFGEVEEATNNTDADIDRIYGSKIVTDLTFGYDFTENFNLTVGANNLLDVYPDEADPEFQSSGRFIYSRRSTQFGTNGRHLFARLTLKIK